MGFKVPLYVNGKERYVSIYINSGRTQLKKNTNDSIAITQSAGLFTAFGLEYHASVIGLYGYASANGFCQPFAITPSETTRQ